MTAHADSHRPRPRVRSSALSLAVGAIAVAVVLARADWAAFLRSLAMVDHTVFVGFIAAFVLALLAADTLATVPAYRHAAPSLRFGTFFVARGASYLPSILNHHVGQAWLTFALARRERIDLGRMAGATLLAYVTWGGCLLLLACAALPAAGLSAGWLAVPLGLGLGYLLILASPPARLAQVAWLAPLISVGPAGHLRLMALRLPHLLVLFVGTWLPFVLFGIDLPWRVALVYVPVLMVVVTLPLTPLGLGTRDAVAAAFFAPFAPGETEAERIAAVAAATTSTALALIVAAALVGLLLARPATRSPNTVVDGAGGAAPDETQ